MRVAERSSGSASPRFSRQRAEQGGLVVTHDDAGVGAAYKGTPFNVIHGLRGMF